MLYREREWGRCVGGIEGEIYWEEKEIKWMGRMDCDNKEREREKKQQKTIK